MRVEPDTAPLVPRFNPASKTHLSRTDLATHYDCLVRVEVGQRRHERVRAEVRRVVARLLKDQQKCSVSAWMVAILMMTSLRGEKYRAVWHVCACANAWSDARVSGCWSANACIAVHAHRFRGAY